MVDVLFRMAFLMLYAAAWLLVVATLLALHLVVAVARLLWTTSVASGAHRSRSARRWSVVPPRFTEDPVFLRVAAALGSLMVATPSRAMYEAEIASAVLSVEEVHVVPRALVMAVITAESGWNPRAISRAGALGLMQLMPATAAKAGVRREELFVPERNILAGTRLLAVLLRHYRGDLVSALVAYNAGARRPNAPVPQNGERTVRTGPMLLKPGEVVDFEITLHLIASYGTVRP